MRPGLVKKFCLASLALATLWMDVCLYYHIQAITSVNNPVESHGPHQPSSPGADTESALAKYWRRLSSSAGNTQSASDTLRPVNATIETTLSSTYQLGGPMPYLASKFSYAFQGMSVKLILSDPVDNYILGPLADSFGGLCNFRDKLSFISANMVSVSGVLSALLAARFVISRRMWLAFVFFQLRNWLDNLDGVVARSRLGITKHVSLRHTSGYIVDGACDAIGFLVFVWAVYRHLRQHSLHMAYRHLNKSVRASASARSNHRRLLWLIGLFLLQLALSSAAWNRYILKYSDLLESPSSGPLQSALKLSILKSSVMFVIIWFWRLTNGHSLMQLLAVSTLTDRTWNFLERVKFVGFIEILALVVVTQLHTLDTGNFLALTSAGAS